MNTFILRWNPNISSYKMEGHKDVCERIENGPVFYNWSIREWQDLKAGDAFVLLQVGIDNDGIAMIGKFISNAYEGDSWRKDGTKIHYADIQIFYACDLSKRKSFTAKYFENKFPNIKWHEGHSGEKISEQDGKNLIERIDYVLEKRCGFGAASFSDFLKNDNRFLPIDPEEKKEELLALLAPYNPVVHTGEEDDWDWFWDEGDYAIEIKSPCSDSEEDSLCIAYEDSGFTLRFAGWDRYFKMIEIEYAELLKLIKSILENKVYVLKAFDNDSETDAVVAELLPVNQSKVKISYWNSNRLLDIKQ